MRRRAKRRQVNVPELDITAFLNLMVILVPFLLITAVFSRITVLDLYLPPAADSESVVKEKFRLEIIIRENLIIVKEAGSGFKRVIKTRKDVEQVEQLSKVLIGLKEKYPGERSASILAEPDVSYDVLVQVMDKVRMKEVVVKNDITLVELFPGISIGDAPEVKKRSSGK